MTKLAFVCAVAGLVLSIANLLIDLAAWWKKKKNP